ncbi:MAG: sugar transferase [Calditrichaeota bacterium]|nr:sugar transferase [Calditrichota bacterium]
MVYQITKRAFDFLVATLGLIFLMLPLLSLSLLIVFDNPGPVFYRGVRVGRFGKTFRIFKFRTMVVNAEQIGPSSTSENDPRITRVGRFLRRFKIDELPQLFNVWLGQMSFVGPRPEVQKFVDLYTEEEKLLINLRPGITDWASLNFPNEDEILKAHTDEFPDADEAYTVYIRPEKIRLQLEYARKSSLITDIKIILKTIALVIKK